MLALFLIAACASATDQTTPTPGAVVSTTTETIAAPTTTTIATTTTVPLDPAQVVADSLASSIANYRFTSVILVGEETLTSIGGIVDGEAVAAEIATGTSEVSYVRTAEGEWVTGPDGEWVELEGEPPVGAPLAALSDVGGLVLESGDASQAVITGVMGPAAGSAQGIAFTLTVEDGHVTEIRYEVDTGGETAQVVTTLSEFGSAGTVSKPEGV